MKQGIKIIAMLLLLSMLIPANIPPAEAAVSSDENVIYYEDGSYITIELIEYETRALNMITGSKSYTCQDSSGAVLWKAVLTGTFSYNGSSATCTVSACDVTITNKDWYVISKTASKSGNIARANVAVGYKRAGVTIDERAISIKLTCDAKGNLS